MGSSPDGTICYGLTFPDEHQFPWNEHEEGEIDGWWRSIRGYSHPQGGPYENTEVNESGRTNGWTDENINEYYDHRRQWEEDNPLPVEVVECYSSYADAIVLAVPGTVLTSSDGEAMEFDPNELDDTLGVVALNRFLQFIDQHSLVAVNPNPCWILTSYYG